LMSMGWGYVSDNKRVNKDARKLAPVTRALCGTSRLEFKVTDIHQFDVFLSHNGKEKPLAVRIGERLRDRGLRVWLDEWELRPGLSWQDGLVEGLSSSRSCAVLIGESGYGGWHKREMEAALVRQSPEYPVIPVLIPGAPDRAEIGTFISLLTWVDLRSSVDDTEGIDRLIWGITGERPKDKAKRDTQQPCEVHHLEEDHKRFHIKNPKNGDLLVGPSIFAGTGPPNEKVFIHYRSPAWDDFRLGSMTDTDEFGRWVTLGPESWYHFGLDAGAYEIYAAGVQDKLPSQLVTVFYRDASNVNRIAKAHAAPDRTLEVSCDLYTAFMQTTELKRGRKVASAKVAGQIDEIQSLAMKAGESIAQELRALVPEKELDVRIVIDDNGRINLSPETAWVSFYAFPVGKDARAYGFPPGTDLPSVQGMRETQMAWRLVPRVGRIPSKPFGDDYEAKSKYLEVRHDGYRPEFIPLGNDLAQTLQVRLSPVLHKRIAVLDFPYVGGGSEMDGFSQLIAREVVAAIERCPELATFGYLSESAPDREHPMDFFEQLGRPSAEIGNEVLNLHDVQTVREQLESVDTRMVSGEGRYLQRKALDIQFIVRGSYRISEKLKDAT
jgi:hypothetical protein